MKKFPLCMFVVSAFALVIALTNTGPLVTSAEAYETWSRNRDATNCRACHGDFRAANYVSASDGTAWNANLHDPHRNTWLGGQCNVCHSGSSRFPVSLFSSAGVTAIAGSTASCTGCHDGPGLRNHHELNVAAGLCADCHGDDALGREDTKPSYYGNAIGTMPADSCNTAAMPRNENKFGQFGLDNDGDGLYDGNDPDCATPPTPESGAQCFDGVDNDADGAIDCADPGCGGATGAVTNCGVGACAATGNRACQGGQLVDTCKAGTPQTEGPFGNATCSDQVDNDCDASTDGADSGCVQTCVPSPEVCDGLDNDCDGQVDEGVMPQAINCGTGQCQANGQRVCVGGAWMDQCTPGQPQTEVCNNLDDDCNGVIDNIDPVPTACGAGACANTGQLVCQNGQAIDNCTPLAAGTEGPFGDATCSDQIDNDCDGLTDPADSGCAQVCVPQPETCDGIDNDCDGAIDEGIAPADISCGAGACANTGVRVCVNGAFQDQCTPLSAGTEGPFGDSTCTDAIDNNCNGLADAADPGCAQVCVPTQEVCDGLDNDCDGVIDNNLPTTPTTCGVGGCATTGELVCQNGQFSDTCVPQQAGVEGPFGDPACSDNVDNDCDALVDSTDPGCNVPPVEEACFDQVDNDGDGLVDCADPDCAGAVDGACATGLAGTCAAGQVECVNGKAACVQLELPQAESCADGTDNDCDGLTDAADPDCMPRGDVDIDIETFRATQKVDLCGRQKDARIRLSVAMENEENTPACADVTVVGVIKGVEIYRHVMNVCLNGSQESKVAFPEPNLEILQIGTITWTATIADGNADVDTQTQTTRVVCGSGNNNDKEDAREKGDKED